MNYVHRHQTALSRGRYYWKIKMPVYLSLNTIAEIICFLIAMFCLVQDKSKVWKGFIPYMLLVCITESCGIYLRNHHTNNYMIYAVYMFFECLMVSCFFYHIYKRYNHKIIVLYAWMGLFLVVYLTEMISSNFKSFPSNTATFMSVVFVIASLYFYVLIIKDEKFRQLGTYPPFWIANGILLYYFGSTACNVFYDYLVTHESGIAPNLSIRYTIFNLLNVLLYACWSYAFICRYYQRKLSS